MRTIGLRGAMPRGAVTAPFMFGETYLEDKELKFAVVVALAVVEITKQDY